MRKTENKQEKRSFRMISPLTNALVMFMEADAPLTSSPDTDSSSRSANSSKQLMSLEFTKYVPINILFRRILFALSDVSNRKELEHDWEQFVEKLAVFPSSPLREVSHFSPTEEKNRIARTLDLYVCTGSSTTR